LGKLQLVANANNAGSERSAICSRRLSIWGYRAWSGNEVVHRLREVDASLAIVLITGWKLEIDASRLAAFDFYLHKPFGHLQRVQTVVQRAVDLYQQRVEGYPVSYVPHYTFLKE